MIGVAVILENGRFMQGYIKPEAVIAIQEDPDNKNRSYILLASGHDMHIDLPIDSLYKMIKG